MLRMSRLSSDECRALLNLARRAISSAVIEKRILDLDFPSCPSVFTEPAGAFVTLHRNGQLRGCVGQVESPDPLAETVARAAINAALHDSRFPAVEASEVSSLEIEISVLGRPEPITPEEILLGRHGLLIVKGEHRGLLLPQVASERRWSSQRFLEETCVKADLPRDAWREPSTRIFAFAAEVFSDTSLRVGYSVRTE
jgi:AmmeMemoRadiSam system protein A